MHSEAHKALRANTKIGWLKFGVWVLKMEASSVVEVKLDLQLPFGKLKESLFWALQLKGSLGMVFLSYLILLGA